jgi:hypothetical protein
VLNEDVKLNENKGECGQSTKSLKERKREKGVNPIYFNIFCGNVICDQKKNIRLSFLKLFKTFLVIKTILMNLNSMK